MEWAPFPDTEAMAIAAIRASDAVAGRAYSKIPTSPEFPLAVVRRLGGIPVEKHRVDTARLQVDVWAQTDEENSDGKAAARDAADAARIAIFAQEGVTNGDFSGVFTAVEPEIGLMWMPDPETGRGRYLFTVQVTAVTVGI